MTHSNPPTSITIPFGYGAGTITLRVKRRIDNRRGQHYDLPEGMYVEGTVTATTGEAVSEYRIGETGIWPADEVMQHSNPRIPIPAGMATATREQVFDALAMNVDDADIGEAAQRGFIVRVLAALGHSHAPEILTSMLDGARVRLYVWKDSPAGDFVLVTGPQYKGKLVRPESLVERDDGFYLRAVPDQSKAAESVLKAAAAGRAEAARAATAMQRAEKAAAAAEARETTPRQHKPRATAPSMEAAIPVAPRVAAVETVAPPVAPAPRKPRAARPAPIAEVPVAEQSDEAAAAALAAKLEAMFA